MYNQRNESRVGKNSSQRNKPKSECRGARGINPRASVEEPEG
jgi:hypothetical protein